MVKQSTFDRLISNLSSEERKNMLERIKSSIKTSETPLIENFKESSRIDLKECYRREGLFRKIFIILKSLFLGADKLKIYENVLLKDLWKDLSKNGSKFFSVDTGVVKKEIYLLLRELQDALKIFKIPLDNALGKDKKDFFVFLGGMEMEITQETLLEYTSFPFFKEELENNIEYEDEKQFKRAMEKKIENILRDIAPIERNWMYNHSRALTFLHNLVFFPFSEMLLCFKRDENDTVVDCDVKDIKKYLEKLSDILYSLQIPPAVNLLKTLFIFQNRENMDDPDFEDKLKDRLKAAEKSFNVIRKFNKQVPLLNMLKVILNDINYSPEALSGGEDWFLLYSQFWRTRFKDKFKMFVSIRKKGVLEENVRNLLKISKIPVLSHYNSSNLVDHKYKFIHVLSFQFIIGFFEMVFLKKLNGVLKQLLIDAEFYKEKNRKDYTEAYNLFLKIGQDSMNINKRLSPDGDLGKEIENIDRDMAAVAIRRKKKRIIFIRADREIGIFINNIKNASQVLLNVVNGVLFGEVGGIYDTIINKTAIGGTKNRLFLSNLSKFLDIIKDFNSLLTEIYDYELFLSGSDE